MVIVTNVILIASLIGVRAFAQPVARSQDKTLANLNAAMQDEANRAHRYTLFARKADEEGYRQVAKLFRAAAQSELIHQQNHRTALLALGGRAQEIELAPVPVGTTRQNLREPVRGERYEAGEMYPDYMEQARHDEAEPAYRSFKWARDAEAQHMKLFAIALRDLGRNPPVDYYVGARSGDLVTELPVRPSEEYIEIH